MALEYRTQLPEWGKTILPPVETLKTGHPERDRAIDAITVQYMNSVYAFLRQLGHSRDDAQELAQEFLSENLVDLVRKADRSKGRFRSFLKVALRNYSHSARRKSRTRKRGGQDGKVSLDSDKIPEPIGPAATPDEAFTYAWASALLDTVLAEVKDGCLRDGLGAHWAVFHARVVMPCYENVDPPSLAEVCSERRIASEARASNMAITVKRRFQKALQSRVRQFVDSDEGVGAEIQDLMRILGRGGAG